MEIQNNYRDLVFGSFAEEKKTAFYDFSKSAARLNYPRMAKHLSEILEKSKTLLDKEGAIQAILYIGFEKFGLKPTLTTEANGFSFILEGLEEVTYVCHLTLKSSAEAAIQQVEARHYCQDCLGKSNKHVIAVGLNYTPEKGVTVLFKAAKLEGDKVIYAFGYQHPPAIDAKRSRKASLP